MANPEAVFISALLRNGDDGLLTKHNITPDLFDAHKEPFTWLYRYTLKYGKLPSKQAFKTKWPSCPIYRTDDVDAAADDLKQDFARRSVTNILDEAVDELLKGDITGAIDKMNTKLLRTQAAMADAPDDFDLSANIDVVYAEVQSRIERVQKYGNAGIPTGFPTLDHATGGLQSPWYTIVNARYGKGKTWTLVRMACEAALRGYSALYYTLEQSETQIAMRTHAILSKQLRFREVFNNLDLQRGTGFDVMHYRKFLESLDNDLPGRLVINGARRERVSPMTVAGGIERIEPDIVFIDYITLMGMKGDGGWQSVAGLSADLQQLCQRFDVPIVAASQLNRSGEISRADSIGHDADLVIKTEQKSPQVALLTVEKFRHGPGGMQWYCDFRPGKGIYDEVSGDEASQLMEEED